MTRFAMMVASLLAALPLGANAAAPAAPVVPKQADQSLELAALPGGGWLGLDKRGLRLFGADGGERASMPMRAKQLDLRAAGTGGALAVVLDSVSEHARLVTVDLEQGALRAGPVLPQQNFGIETLCLYRDSQQLAHLFVAAKDGQAEQWLVDGKAPALVRKLALPPGSKSCRVDDARSTLYVSEPQFGLWAYGAASEAPPSRSLVALRKPMGTLESGAGAVAVLPGAVAMLDKDGKFVHVFEQKGGAWRQRSRQPAAAGSHKLATLAGEAGTRLLARSDSAWYGVGPAVRGQARAPELVVMPQAQTDPMRQLGDVADDPAIWVHPTDPARSRVLGTNKKQGLAVYDMQGRQTQFLESGRVNNVDVRQRVKFGAESVDLAVASQRDDNSVVVYGIDPDGKVAELVRLPTDLDKIYGICLYQPAAGGLDTFVNDADGRYRQYRIERQGTSYGARLVRQFKVATQPEGCVADDRRARLFLGEERRGLWTMAADPDQPATMSMVLPVGPQLVADVEGMGIYHGKEADYLVVSSQGSNNYVVLDAVAPYRVRGTFRVGFNVAAGIDGTAETDGLEVSSANLGGQYADGMLVIQDGYKRLPDGTQNFKYVRWADVAEGLKLR